MTDSPENPSRPAAGTPPVDGSRRRLLRGGAAAAPVLWAVTTRPAIAATTQCATTSRMGSIHASTQGKVVEVCSGRTPGYWRSSAHFDKWPHPYYASDEANHKASRFHATGCRGGYFGTKTMLEVLKMSGQGGNGEFGAYITAAILNAQRGMTPVLTVSQVLNLWNECTGRGYFEPTAGVKWSREDVIAYLKTTMPG